MSDTHTSKYKHTPAYTVALVFVCSANSHTFCKLLPKRWWKVLVPLHRLFVSQHNNVALAIANFSAPAAG